MKKVVCPQCGLVNLDKFVSFPHCAACGALLPQQAPSKWRAVWRRPVRPLYWMLAVGSGVGMLGLAIASLVREARDNGDKPLVVYAQIPRDVAPGQTVTAQFTLDSALENPEASFNRVSLRLSRETQRDFVTVTVQPTPVAIEMRGSGRYYLWNNLPRNTALQLALTPRSDARGVLRLHAAVWAAEYKQFDVRASLETKNSRSTPPATRDRAYIVAPTPMQSRPKVAR